MKVRLFFIFLYLLINKNFRLTNVATKVISIQNLNKFVYYLIIFIYIMGICSSIKKFSETSVK